MNNFRNLIARSTASPAWTPALLSLRAWYRADTLISAGGIVTSWTDKGPNGYNATPHGSPTVVSSVINGQPVVRLVGASSQYFDFAGATALVDKSTACWIVIVTKATAQISAGGFGVFLSIGATGASRYSLFNSEAANYGQISLGGGSAGTDTNCNKAAFNYYSSFYYLIDQYNGAGSFSTAANHTLLTNGGAAVALANGTGNVNTSNTLSTIGQFGASGLFYSGDIAEIIIADAGSGADITNLKGYLLARYGL